MFFPVEYLGIFLNKLDIDKNSDDLKDKDYKKILGERYKLLIFDVSVISKINDDELFFRSMDCIKTLHGGEIVVIGKNQEVVVVLPIPADNVVRRTISITIQSVSMGVALVPFQCRASLLGEKLGSIQGN